jgi:hypothetical protein
VSTRRAGVLSAAIVCGAVVAVGCKEQPDEPESVQPCSGAVTISVNLDESQPRFFWKPTCAVSALVVLSAPASGPQVEHWRVQANDVVIPPPVTYGRLPSGAQSAGLVPLTSNQDYHISIFIPGRVLPIGDGTWHQP